MVGGVVQAQMVIAARLSLKFIHLARFARGLNGTLSSD